MRRSNSKVNYLYSVAYQMLTALTPLLTAPYLARVIGADGVGIYSYFNSIASYFAMVGMLGLTNYGNRYIARVRDKQEELNYFFSSIFYMQIILGIIVSVLYVLYTVFWVNNNKEISWIMLLPVLATIINLTWFYWGLEEFRVTVTRSIVIKLITLFSIFFFVKTKNDLWKYCLILSIGTFGGNIPLILLLRKYVRLVKVDIRDVLAHVKPNLVLFIPVLSVSVYRTMDKVMLGWMSTYRDVGYYENADKIINICLGFITALGQVMLPKSANLVENGKVGESNKLIVKSFNFSSLFCSAIVFGLIGIADKLVPIFFGNEFLPSIMILSLLAPNLFLLAWGNVLKTQFLMPRGKDKAYIMATLTGAFVNVIVNILLIPKMQGVGAAIGTISAELISLIYIIYIVRLDFDFKVVITTTRYVILGAIMMITVFFVGKMVSVSVAGVLIMILIGACIYVVGCFILFKLGDDLLCEMVEIAKKIFVKSRISRR